MKGFAVALIILVSAMFCGCSQIAEARSVNSGIDFNLTELSDIMAYSELYNMMAFPDTYIGKTIKIYGAFSVYRDNSKGKNYYSILVSDTSACCEQGIEFVWQGDHSYPDDYPKQGSWITVTGVFETYEEDGYTYCQLLCDNIDTNPEI